MITEYRLNMIKSSIVNEKELFNDDFEINKLRKKGFGDKFNVK